MNYPNSNSNLELPKAPDIYYVEKSYRDSFVFNEDFTGKRFKRYVERIKKFIFENYVNLMFENEMSSLKYDNLVDFIMGYFQSYYLGEYEEDELEGTLFACIHEYMHPVEKEDLDEDCLMDYLCFSEPTVPLSFENVINAEIEAVCKDFIRFQCLEMENVDESNYFLTLPTDSYYAILLFDKIINYIKVDIDNFCSSLKVQEMRKVLKQKTVKVLKESNQEFLERIKLLEEELSESKKTIDSLNNKIKLKNTEKQFDNSKQLLLSEQNEALTRQNDKIKEKYNQLLSKYKDLKKEANDKVIDTEVQEEFNELDKNGNYLFIAYEDVTFRNTILNEFPNSNICDSNININASNTDLVIVLTEHINHSTYYAIKEQCKSKNIPLVHCRFSNIELIKELMWNCLNL